MILRESQWFTPDPIEVGKALKDVLMIIKIQGIS
jgi:hypothetical protein